MSRVVAVATFFSFQLGTVCAQTQDTTRTLNEVLIMDSRANDQSPFTTSNLTREQLDEAKSEVSIPFMLELQPSVVVSGENGKMGETSMRIRGVDASRINVNINGITLNDPESQAVFWYNVPNLGGMAQSLQIQRGLGASNGGGNSFGGAINLQTLNAREHSYGEADITLGSWNTRQYGIVAGTGITKKGFAFDIAYNGQTTDGYIRNGFADQQSLFASASRYGKRSLLKAVAIIGTQHTGITWNGEDASVLEANPTYNSAGEYYDNLGNVYYYSNESDNYNQRRYQLYYSLLMNGQWSLKAVADFTHGDGYYEQYKADKKFSKYGIIDCSGKSDFITQKKMWNSAYTGNVSANYTGSRVDFTFGEMFLYFDGDHFGDVIWCKDLTGFDTKPYEWYRYKGNKVDATTYAKADWDATSRLNLYADVQLRYVDYSIKGIEDDLYELDFHETYPFFNPKVGANYLLGNGRRLYALAGVSHREPTRSDIKDAFVRGDTVKAETMLDIELGYQVTRNRYAFSINGYAMLYKDQLTPNGNLSSSGYSLMENVDKSYRLGVELVAGYRFTDWFRLDANLTLSMNKIIDYTYTDFVEGDTVLTTYTRNTDLSYSPNIIGAAIATFEPVKNFKLQLSGKYVGSQYLDNTSRDCYRQDAYFLLNLKMGYTWKLKGSQEIEAQVVLNNLLDHHYRIGAWAGDGYWEGYYHYAGWYQQPGFNCLSRVSVRF